MNFPCLVGRHEWLRYRRWLGVGPSPDDPEDQAFVTWGNGARVEVCSRCGKIKGVGRAPVEAA